jgi:hypothetical protein
VGLVFAITDDLLGNRIVVFPRFSNGSISAIGNFYATGGLGSGLNGSNSLGSQHSIVVSTNGDRVYCVNAGSNSISVFGINADFSLTLLALLDSGGEFPIALALSLDNTVLYCLNGGGQGRLAAIDLTATLGLSVNLPGLLDLNVGLALNLGLFGQAPVAVINLNQFANCPSCSASGPISCNITGVNDIVISPDGSWIILANKATGTIITIPLQGGVFLPIQLGLAVSLSVLSLNLGVDLAVGVDLNLGISLGLGVSVAPLSLAFAGTSTLLVGIGGVLNGLLTFNFDCSTGQLTLIGNTTTTSSSTSGSSTGSSAGSSTGSTTVSSSGGGTFVTSSGNIVFVNPGFLGLGGLLAGVLNLVDGLLVVVDHVVDNLLDDLVPLVDNLLFNVVATVDGLLYSLGLGGVICAHTYNATTNTFVSCGCTHPIAGLQGLAVL